MCNLLSVVDCGIDTLLNKLVAKIVKDTSDRTQELFAAIQTSDVEQVKELLKLNISLEYKDNNGQTPLTLASSVGNLEIIRLLITAGA